MAGDGPMEEAPALRVPRALAETARLRLVAQGLAARHLVPIAGEDTVDLPVDSGEAAGLEDVAREFPGASSVVGRFPRRAAPTGDYRPLLDALPAAARALLPRAHDVVGDIAILKLPDALLVHKEKIAAAVLAARPGIRAVALDRGVKGEYRVRDLELLAGAGPLRTVHREHGMDIEVDLAATYFSPRLATERDRLLARIRDGARVLDLFAGVGAFVVRVARERSRTAVCAIDVNPAAVRLLRRNLERNGVAPGRVEVREGDARAVAPASRDWDHVVMNLPHDAHRFLDVAARCVAPHGEVHLYAVLERTDVSRYTDAARDALEASTGSTWHLAETRHVRAYAPTMDGWGFTFAGAG